MVAAFAVLFSCLLGAFSYLAIKSQSDSRHQAQQRFTGEASLAAQFTSSLFNASVASGQATAKKALGGPKVSTADVDALVKQARTSAYVLVLDSRGKVIAASSGAAARARAAVISSQPHVQAAIAGRPTFSNLIPGSAAHKGYLLEWALPYTTSAGTRIVVEALPPQAISAFLDSYLTQVEAANPGGTTFILDGNDREVGVASTASNAPAVGATTASPVGARPKSGALLGALAHRSQGSYSYSGADRYFVAAPIAGTTWRVVLASPTSSLYPALAGSRSWLLYVALVAFGLLGALNLWLYRNSVRGGIALARANTTLEDRVQERTAAAEERARELARSNAELEQFSSIASHDLQEPLRKIRMFSDRLREKLGDDLAEGPAEDLARIENASARMQRLINDLLDFSRVTHRGNEFESVDLREVAAEVASDLEARVVELGAKIDVAELPVIEADRTQMRQLLQNLVGNALKFHRTDEPPVVRISSTVVPPVASRFPGESTAAGRTVITVADNGIGFDAKHAERVFGAFERLHGRSAYEGTGIGLSIARKIVWRHGGHISAAGVPNEGATFTVTLPLAQPAQANGHEGGA